MDSRNPSQPAPEGQIHPVQKIFTLVVCTHPHALSHVHTDGTHPVDTHRDWGDAHKPGNARTASHLQRVGDRPEGILLQDRQNTASPPLWPQGPSEQNFCCSKAPCLQPFGTAALDPPVGTAVMSSACIQTQQALGCP